MQNTLYLLIELCSNVSWTFTTSNYDIERVILLKRKPHFSFSFSIDIHLRYNNKIKSCEKVSCCIVVSKRHGLLLNPWTQYKQAFNASYYIPRWCVSRGKWKPIANISGKSLLIKILNIQFLGTAQGIDTSFLSFNDILFWKWVLINHLRYNDNHPVFSECSQRTKSNHFRM